MYNFNILGLLFLQLWFLTNTILGMRTRYLITGCAKHFFLGWYLGIFCGLNDFFFQVSGNRLIIFV